MEPAEPSVSLTDDRSQGSKFIATLSSALIPRLEKFQKQQEKATRRNRVVWSELSEEVKELYR